MWSLGRTGSRFAKPEVVISSIALLCAESCDGDQEWTECGSETTLTCENQAHYVGTVGVSDACVPRCQCPADRPIWDDQRNICINADECVDYWK